MKLKPEIVAFLVAFAFTFAFVGISYALGVPFDPGFPDKVNP